MCVSCTLSDGQDFRHPLKLGSWRMRYYIGGWRNFLPRPDGRGEGNPGPWLMIWRINYYGFELQWPRVRPWLTPEFSISDKGGWAFLGNGKVYTTPATENRSIMWGIFHIAWRP